MNILYVAKHENGQGDDEGAIHNALECLGHNVQRVREVAGHRAFKVENCEVCLFHKWEDWNSIQNIQLPKVFWYFDLVEFPDPATEVRNERRREWMRRVMPLVQLGFCTDGDWVNKDKTGKLVLLRQGADQRLAGAGIGGICPHCKRGSTGAPLLFTGIRNGGVARAFFVDEMVTKYQQDFLHIPAGAYGRNLADLIASCQIVVAPDAPVTDHYWSNRVYTTLGYKGFLMHPYCSDLATEYEDGKEIVFYRSRGQLHSFIDHYRSRPEDRERIAAAALDRTLKQHTYLERCKILVKTIQERLKIGV